MRIVALDKYDNIEEGTVYDCPDAQANKLIAKGLAKEAPVPHNKMAAASDNKANPSVAAGEGRPSSASQAAQASAETTAQPYPGGGLVTPDPRFTEESKPSAPAKPKKAAAKKTARKAPAKSRDA